MNYEQTDIIKQKLYQMMEEIDFMDDDLSADVEYEIVTLPYLLL